MGSRELEHVHETREEVAAVEMTPPHPPREETPEYARAHHFLIYEKKAACRSCRVNVDTLGDPALNRYGATQMESHHYPIERSLMDACDPRKVHDDFPQVYDLASLAAFVDSPANLIVLCDVCHRSPERGIHHLLTQDYAIQRYLRDGYQVAARMQDAARVEAADEHIEEAAGLESETEDDAVEQERASQG